MKGGQTLVTCSLRPTMLYGEDFQLIKEFWEQCTKMGGVMLAWIPDEVKLSRIYAGERSRRTVKPGSYSYAMCCALLEKSIWYPITEKPLT